VVDDNVDAAETLADLLRVEGHSVTVAHDGPEALSTLDRSSPDIAILDIGLPVMDGYELAERLRERVCGVTMLALTGYGQDHDRARSAAAGFVEHLIKPIDIEQILRAIGSSDSVPVASPA
jgi:CheY-like chemotaxis protein